MVCGLVEQHQIGLAGEKPGQRCAPPLAPRGSGTGRGGVEFEPLRHRFQSPALRGLQLRARPVAERRMTCKIGILLHIADTRAGRDAAAAAVGLDQPRDHLQKRRLARAIAPHQSQPVAGLDHQIHMGKQRPAAEAQRHVGKLQKRCASHGRRVAPRTCRVNRHRRARTRSRSRGRRARAGSRGSGKPPSLAASRLPPAATDQKASQAAAARSRRFRAAGIASTSTAVKTCRVFISSSTTA